ncbi:thioredoxin family protein [Lutibacter sp.]|uniref:thioredoxin family protein n=1 Tax=Lutibacter sp. TaxID=1925666 RepID=UPI00273552B5|nr:thioredoxin family protein [Lutibacter sp.]MDP3313653.1 thioredoxin family protein [Lutibacter sp.]
MKKLILCVFIVGTLNCKAQKQEVYPKIDQSGNLIGITQKEFFSNEPFNIWFDFNYEDHIVNKKVLAKITPLLKDVTIKGFMGTWCGDSQEHIPVFYKIMDEAGLDYKNLEMIAVDRAKVTPDNLQAGYDIQRVPTFIFFRNGKEIGRFVEYPRESIEADLCKILSGEPYKHAYQQ